MDSDYHQAMIAALMNGGQQPPIMNAQNPSTGYGQGFMTGNQPMPSTAGGPMGMPDQTGGQGGANPLQLQQPYAQYPMMAMNGQSQGY